MKFKRKRKYIPKSNIKILPYGETSLNDIDYCFLGAWNFKDEIFKKEKEFISNGGKFITHIPEVKIIWY